MRAHKFERAQTADLDCRIPLVFAQPEGKIEVVIARLGDVMVEFRRRVWE